MSGKFLKARQLAKEMEEKAKKTAEEKKKATDSLQKAEDLLDFSLELGVDVGEAKDLIDNASKKIVDMRWEEGVEDLNKAMEVLSQANFSVLDDFLDGTKEIHELMGDTERCDGSRKSMESAIELAGEGKFKEALELAKEAMELAKLEIHEKLTDELHSVETHMLTLEGMNKDTTELRDILDQARALAEENNFGEASTLISGVNEKLHGDLQESLNESISRLEILVTKIRNDGEDTTDVEASISKAKSRAKNLDIDGAMEMIKEAQGIINESLENVVLVRFQELRSGMDDAMAIEADMGPVNILLKQAESMRDERLFSEAYNIIEDAFEKLGEAKFHRVLRTIAESRENFIKAKNIGIDISEPMELLNKARDALKEGNHKGALDWAMAGRSKVKELVKEYDEIEARIERSKKMIADLKETNIDLEVAGEIISEAQGYFLDKDYQTAVEKLDEFQEHADKVAYGKVMELIEEFEMNMMTADELGLDVAEHSEMLEKSIAQIKSGIYLEAGKIAQENIGELSEAISREMKVRYENIRVLVEKIRKDLGEDEDLSELNRVTEDMEKVRDVMEKGFHREAIGIIQGISEKLERWQVGEADGALADARELVELVERLGIENIDLKDYMNNIEKAEKALENEDYTTAIQTSHSIVDELNNRMRKTSEEQFAHAKMEVVKAKKAGVDIEESRKRLIDCKKQIRDENYAESIKLSMKIQEEALTLREKRRSSYEIITRISEELTRLRREEGLKDVGAAKQILLKSKESFQNRDYTQAEKLAEQAMLKIEEVHGRYNYENKEKNLKELIAEAEAIGMDASQEEDALELCIRNSNRGEYEIAVEKLSETIESLVSKMEGYVKPEIERTKDIIDSAKDIKIDLSGPETKLNESMELLKKKDFKNSVEKIEACRREIEDIRDKSRKAASQVKQVKERMTEAKDLYADVTEAEIILGRAMDALKKDDYDRTITEALNAEKSISRAEKIRVERLLAAFESKTSDIRRQGINTALADNLLRRAEKAMEKGSYKEAINLAMQSEGELERIELQQDISKRCISTTSDKVNAAKEVGIKVEDADKLLKQAIQAYQAGFYVKAFDNAVKSGDVLNKTVKAHDSTKELMGLLDKAVKSCEYLGWDVQDAKKYMTEGEQAFQRGLYVKALVSTRKAEKSLVSLEKDIPDKLKETENIIKRMKQLKHDAGGSEELLRQAKLSQGIGDVLETFMLIADAMKKAGVDVHNEYNSSITEAVSLLASAHKFGADIGEAERLVEEARTLEFEDIGKARDMAMEALKAVENTLDPYSPKLEMEFKGRIDPEGWSKVTFVMTNTGKGVGKSPSLEFQGCEHKDMVMPSMLKAGETKEIEVELKAIDEKVTVKGSVKRVFDDKSIEDVLEIEPKAGSYQVQKSTGEEKCDLCKGNIKKGLDMIVCSCGETYHKTCGERGNECKKCGTGFAPKKVTSKRVSLKL